jgi:hypothetical protein
LGAEEEEAGIEKKKREGVSMLKRKEGGSGRGKIPQGSLERGLMVLLAVAAADSESIDAVLQQK